METAYVLVQCKIAHEMEVLKALLEIDLVKEQIRVASGTPLNFDQQDVSFTGHAIECRINAENSDTFQPSPGTITGYHPPGGLGVRIDSALYQDYTVPPHYDSLLSKLIVHGTSRDECIMRLRIALEEYVITGIDTTIPFHLKLIANNQFVNGEYDIHWLEKFICKN